MSELEENPHSFWSGAVCFNFLDALLTEVKATLTSNDPTDLYMMEFKPNQNQHSITLKKLTRKPDVEKFKVIPDWFVEKWEPLRR